MTTLRKNYPDLGTLFLGNYPMFIYNHGIYPSLREPAIFVFHEVEHEAFERKLLFLKENGYSCIDSSELDYSIRNQRFDSKKIMLTFDDGDISLFNVVYPLLKKYDFKAVSFICPGLIPEDSMEHTVGDKVRNLCTWPEIREMHESGYIDFQSHSMYHDLVFSSDKLIDFLNPGFTYHYFVGQQYPHILNSSNRFSFVELWPYEEPSDASYFGIPIFELKPKMASRRRFVPSAEAVRSLSYFVSENGGEAFFERKGWRRALKEEFEEKGRGASSRFISGKSYLEEVAQDFILCKSIMESKLPGKKVVHFSAPWCEASQDTLQMAWGCGYASAFLGMTITLPWKIRQLPGTCFFTVPRLPDDYLFCLPGKYRRPIHKILYNRFRNRFGE